MPSNVKLLAGASGGEPTDANFKNVTLLLHGDGSNGAQNNTFIDSSTNNFTITRNGNTTQGSFSPYGSNWSNYFDGSGDYLTAPDNAALQLGSSNFTIEFWVNFSVVPGASQGATLVSKFDTSNTGYEVILYNNTMYFQAQSASIGLTYAWTPTAGRWYHIAWTRSGSNSYGFIDGALVASTSGASGSITNLAQALQLGRRGDNTLYLNGYLSNVRILKGTALYTAAFTPPTAPLTAITNTSLLTCADNRFRDGSTNNFTITRNGDVKVTNFSPFAPSSSYSTTTNGGSAYFDGSGDYLSAPTNTALDCGTGNWTIECWTYISSRTNSYPLVFGNNRGSWTTDALALTNSNADNASYNDKFVFGWNNGGFISPSAGNSQLLVSNVTNELNTWHHLALVRNGTSIKMYRNGVEVASATISSGASFNWGYNGALVGGGNWDGAGSYYNGYISNLRLVKGTAVYTAAFTPPSSPVTAITNTSILLNATNAAIFDNSMKNDLETVGNAQISTSVKKFGTGSIYLDGSGDWLSIPDTDAFDMGSGNFTAEAWIYPTSLANEAMIMGQWSGDTGGTTLNWALMFSSGSTGYLRLITSSNGSGVLFDLSTSSTSFALSTNTWYHIAAVRNGSTFTIYVDGTSRASTTNSSSLYNATNAFTIGAESNTQSQYFTGYIDELRVTKGVARYTANFTPPTAPFPNK